MIQSENKSDKPQRTNAQADDPYRLPPELVKHVRAALDTPGPSPKQS